MPDPVDEMLLAAVDVARAALLEITPADTIGDPVGHIVEGEHVLSLLFDCTMSGYPGWHWTVSLSRIDGEREVSVLETELMPGGDALLAPEWVPWSDRLADYRTAQELAAAVALADEVDALDVLEGDEDDEDEDDDDEDEDDDDDEDEDEDEDDDDDELDRDFENDRADDQLDGIDFGEALAASELHPAEADEAEDDTDDGAPQPPAVTSGDEVAAERERDNQGR
jgi:hypothetical protein